MNDEAINTYLSDESDLNKANSLTPRTKYRRMKFSFVCSQCGQFFKDKDPSKSMVNPYNHKLDGLYEAKHQCMLTNGVTIIVDCSEYEQYVATTYGKDYIKSFRNKRGV